jgi:hypothetical protein
MRDRGVSANGPRYRLRQPVSKRDDLAVLLGIVGDKDGVGIFQGNGMVERIEQMLATLDSKLGCPSKTVRFVGVHQDDW